MNDEEKKATDWNVRKTELLQPNFDDLASVLRSGLRKYFTEINIEIVECPDLTKEPFYLARPGLGSTAGTASLVDVGGPPFLLPHVKREKLYDLRMMPQLIDCGGGGGGSDGDTFVIGAGAGPWPCFGSNCEGVFNVAIANDGRVADNQTRIARIDKGTGGVRVERVPHDETRFALLGNFLVSDGRPSKVLKVYCKNRINETTDYVSSIRKILKEEFREGTIGLGGTFVINEGKARHHVMPDFADSAIRNEHELNEWLRFFEFSAPLVSVGTLITDDLGLDLRLQHFHSFSGHNEGGHYHIDTTPQDVQYLGYFTVAKYLYRIDQPLETHKFGRD